MHEWSFEAKHFRRQLATNLYGRWKLLVPNKNEDNPNKQKLGYDWPQNAKMTITYYIFNSMLSRYFLQQERFYDYDRNTQSSVQTKQARMIFYEDFLFAVSNTNCNLQLCYRTILLRGRAKTHSALKEIRHI